MTRYAFNLRTRSGQPVENIQIMALTQADALRRLRQMYHQCEVVECREVSAARAQPTLDVEGVIGMISTAARASSQEADSP